MPTFEEKFTAWIDGRLSGEELRQFEAELLSRVGAESEKNAALQLGDLLRKEYRAPELRNPDFFNRQILSRIEADAPRRESAIETPVPFWSLWRMTTAGGFSMLIAAVLFYFVVHSGPAPAPASQNLLAKVLDAHTGDPGVTASAFQSNTDDVTVLWLDGLDYIPADYVLK